MNARIPEITMARLAAVGERMQEKYFYIVRNAVLLQSLEVGGPDAVPDEEGSRGVEGAATWA